MYAVRPDNLGRNFLLPSSTPHPPEHQLPTRDVQPETPKRHRAFSESAALPPAISSRGHFNTTSQSPSHLDSRHLHSPVREANCSIRSDSGTSPRTPRSRHRSLQVVTFDDVVDCVRGMFSCDMGYSTRGNGRNYDSLNGYAALVGCQLSQW